MTRSIFATRTAVNKAKWAMDNAMDNATYHVVDNVGAIIGTIHAAIYEGLYAVASNIKQGSEDDG